MPDDEILAVKVRQLLGQQKDLAKELTERKNDQRLRRWVAWAVEFTESLPAK